MTVPQIPLRTSSGTVTIPQLGLGVWQVPEDEAERAVATALEVGYRHIDTAILYGNEAGVGRAVAASGIPRDDVFITTKIWQDSHGKVKEAVEGSLQRLGVDRIDLVLIHWPAPKQDLYVGAWRSLLQLREEGLIRAVGTSNFHPEHLERAHRATGEYPAINQVELHPYLNQAKLSAFHQQHDIITEAWSPLASGKKVFYNPVIDGISEHHELSKAQVILGWHIQSGRVVIPKSVTPSRIKENFEIFDFTLLPEEMEAMNGLDRNFRTGPNPDEFEG